MVKQKLKIWAVIVLVFLSCLPLGGCYDASEIDERAYALVIGVDKGVTNKIRITFQHAAYKEDGGGQEGSGSSGGGGNGGFGELEGTIVSTIEASSLLEGINLLNASLNRRIVLSHAKMLVLSEEYAREGVSKHVEPLVRFREVRDFMRVVVCQGKAEDFIMENRAIFGTNAAKAVDLMFLQSKKTGYFPDVIFNDFYIDMMTVYGQPTAIYAGVNDFEALPPGSVEGDSPLKLEDDIEPGSIPRKGGSKKEMFGTAVFDGDKMVGTLNQDETRFFLMGSGEFQRSFFTLEDPNVEGDIYVVSAHLAKKPEIEVCCEEEVPLINLKLTLDVDIISIQSRKHYEELDQIEGLELNIERYMQEGLAKTIKKTQKEMNSDIFHFGRKAASSFATIDEFKNYNWIAHYQDAKITTDVKVKIRSSGFIFGSCKIRSTTSERGETHID